MLIILPFYFFKIRKYVFISSHNEGILKYGNKLIDIKNEQKFIDNDLN